MLYPRAQWNQIDLKQSQSLTSGVESVLGSTAQWERLADFLPDSRERQMSRPVGRLQILSQKGVVVCTGFLIDPTHIMTNYHCIDAAGDNIEGIEIVMGYYDQGFGSAANLFEVEETPLAESERLDYVILAAPRRAAEEYGYVDLSTRVPEQGERLSLIHHPAGEIMHITQRGCVAGIVPNNNTEELLHRCDSEKGSSGSPVFDSSDKVVALHFGGTVLRGAGSYNYSKLMKAILSDIPEGFLDRELGFTDPTGNSEVGDAEPPRDSPPFEPWDGGRRDFPPFEPWDGGR